VLENSKILKHYSTRRSNEMEEDNTGTTKETRKKYRFDADVERAAT
jgi:hypothetical protein